jgi:HK97 gp10 family phage protein
MGKQIASVRIENDHTEEVLRALKDGTEEILTRWGEAAEGFAKEICPVDTGNLRNSITYDVKESENAVYIGSAVEYAPYVELGTSRMKAKPYLRPAIEDNMQTYENIMNDVIK